MVRCCVGILKEKNIKRHVRVDLSLKPVTMQDIQQRSPVVPQQNCANRFCHLKHDNIFSCLRSNTQYYTDWTQDLYSKSISGDGFVEYSKHEVRNDFWESKTDARLIGAFPLLSGNGHDGMHLQRCPHFSNSQEGGLLSEYALYTYK